MIIDPESLNYSLRNIRQSKSRNIMTILSITVGITTIFVFVSFGLGLINYTNELQTSSTIDKINIQPKGIGPPGLDDTFGLSKSDLEVIEKTSGVLEASGAYFKSAEVKKNDKVRFVWAIGYDPKTPLILELFELDIYKGRELRSGESKKAVLGYNFLFDEKIFPSGTELNDKIEIQGEEFRVVGFYEPLGNPQDDSNIYISTEDLEIIYKNLSGYNWVIARVDLEDIDNIILKVEENLRKSRNLEEGKEDFFVQSFQDLLNQWNTVILFISGFVILIALLSVIVSAVNTANTMITSVLERTKEIGIIKSIGAKNSEIFKIFLFESGFLGFIAGILGVLLGFTITFFTGMFIEYLGFGFLSPSYSFTLFIGLVLFATITGAISGAWPARQASKIKPVEALRYE